MQTHNVSVFWKRMLAILISPAFFPGSSTIKIPCWTRGLASQYQNSALSQLLFSSVAAQRPQGVYPSNSLRGIFRSEFNKEAMCVGRQARLNTQPTGQPGSCPVECARAG